MLVECDRCQMRGIACADCVVTVTTPEGVPGTLGPEELRALSVLADAGMVPPLRLKVVAKGPTRQRTWGFPATQAS